MRGHKDKRSLRTVLQLRLCIDTHACVYLMINPKSQYGQSRVKTEEEILALAVCLKG
jgi:hypothetical protein